MREWSVPVGQLPFMWMCVYSVFQFGEETTAKTRSPILHLLLTVRNKNSSSVKILLPLFHSPCLCYISIHAFLCPSFHCSPSLLSLLQLHSMNLLYCITIDAKIAYSTWIYLFYEILVMLIIIVNASGD